MNNLFKKFLITGAVVFLSFLPMFLQAQSAPPAPNKNYISNLKKFSENAGFSSQQSNPNSIAKTIGRMASVVISFVGTIFIIINVYSGIEWMTSGGNEKKISEAKTRIINASGGLILLALAYILTKLVTSFFK